MQYTTLYQPDLDRVKHFNNRIVQTLLEGTIFGEHAEDNEAKLSGNGAERNAMVLARCLSRW